MSIGATILLGLFFIAGEFISEAQSLNSSDDFSAGKATEPSLPRPINPTIELDVAQPVISDSFLAKSDAGGKLDFPVQPTGSVPAPEDPDLDLGYCNYLDIHFKVPAAFDGDVNLTYNCTGPGMNGSPESHGTVTIPNSLIPRDGSEHSYRLDMGLQPYWRGRLTGLNLAASAGTADFEGATVGVGDLPDDHYLANREFPIYMIARLNQRRPARIASTEATANEKKTLFSNEMKKLSEEWLERLRANAHIQTFAQ